MNGRSITSLIIGALVVGLLLMNAKDLRRYVKISNM
jgi:hypothetical protein